LCKSKYEGGIGLRDIEKFNAASLAKWEVEVKSEKSWSKKEYSRL